MDSVIRQMIRKGQIRFAGNRRLKIYGTLRCASGKRMKRENRVFFRSEKEALMLGFRPCGNCMRQEYQFRVERLDALRKFRVEFDKQDNQF